MRIIYLIAMLAVIVPTSGRAEIHPDSTATIAALLDDAGCPLTDAQSDTLASLVSGMGFGDIYHTLYITLNDEQKDALIEDLGPWQGTPEWRTVPRWIHFVVLFDRYNLPLTKSQMDRLKALPTGPSPATGSDETPEKIEDILTSEQISLMLEAYNQRGDN